ncbi:MAG: DNA replication/repair protein RecF [Oscillospiraceae bacterium]|nr:DNA replication/repair protein RecF [Oscillospiraceae bacterium]
MHRAGKKAARRAERARRRQRIQGREALYLIRHSLANYRNIESLEFYPATGVNVVSGENGQGKTNLLESIFLLTGARSFRGGRDASLVRSGEECARVDADFFLDGRDQNIRIVVGEKGRTASLNKGTPTKAAALVGKFCAVVFSPEHLSLVKGAPELRRRFIDTALCQISSSYLGNIKRYARLLDQKNSLLKDSRTIAAAGEMLDVYDAQLADAACEISNKRSVFVRELLPLAAANYERISNGRETLDFQYRSSLFPDGEGDPDEALEAIYAQRAIDIRAGFSTVGPHRDDLFFALDGGDAKVYASQGQQRCIVLSLKLAEAELMELKLGERPALLLDDVLSELDERRQNYLIESLQGCQSVITCCAPELIAARTEAAVFLIEDGRLRERA